MIIMKNQCRLGTAYEFWETHQKLKYTFLIKYFSPSSDVDDDAERCSDV
jgi:hypothetical protein